MSRLTKAIKEEIYNNICFEKINKVRNGHKADFRKLCQEVVEDWLLTEMAY